MAGFDPLARPGAARSRYRRDRLTIPNYDQVIARTESTDEFHQLVGKVAGVDPSRVHSGPSGSARARDGLGTGAMRSRHDVGWFHTGVTEAIDGHVASPPERLSNSAISPKQSSARDRRLLQAEAGVSAGDDGCSAGSSSRSTGVSPGRACVTTSHRRARRHRRRREHRGRTRPAQRPTRRDLPGHTHLLQPRQPGLRLASHAGLVSLPSSGRRA